MSVMVFALNAVVFFHDAVQTSSYISLMLGQYVKKKTIIKDDPSEDHSCETWQFVVGVQICCYERSGLDVGKL